MMPRIDCVESGRGPDYEASVRLTDSTYQSVRYTVRIEDGVAWCELNDSDVERLSRACVDDDCYWTVQHALEQAHRPEVVR